MRTMISSSALLYLESVFVIGEDDICCLVSMGYGARRLNPLVPPSCVSSSIPPSRPGLATDMPQDACSIRQASTHDSFETASMSSNPLRLVDEEVQLWPHVLPELLS